MTQERRAAHTGGAITRRLSGWPVRAIAVVGLTATAATVYRLRNTSRPGSTNPEANGADHSDPAVAVSLDLRTRALILAARVLPTPVLVRLTGLVARFSRPQQDTTTPAGREIAHDG